LLLGLRVYLRAICPQSAARKYNNNLMKLTKIAANT